MSAEPTQVEVLADVIFQATLPIAADQPRYKFDRHQAYCLSLAESVLTSEWLRKTLYDAWDAGFMDAASKDHPAYPRTRIIDNPYEEPK